MRRTLFVLISAFLLTACNGWFFEPSGYNPPTPIRPPTRTPSIFTATPAAVMTATLPVVTSTLAADTPAVLASDTPLVMPTDTASPAPTSMNPFPAVSVKVLGCNTSLDITHGLGEVTNAFVTVTNTGNVDLTNLKATLFALDEGQPHPDKTAEIPLLPVAQQVTLKLTVDSTYNAETPIQVEISADGGLFQRVGENSCKAIGIFAPDPDTLKTPVPVNP